MSNLKFQSRLLRFPVPRFPLELPGRANGALVPAVCAAALAGLAALQLGLTGDVELPAAGWSGGGSRAGLPPIAVGMVPPVLRGTTMFSPGRTGKAASADAPAPPLGGAAVAGAVTVRGRTYAVIQRADGRIVRLAPGGRLDGMTLMALTGEGAVFMKDGQRVRVGFGPAAAGAATADAPDMANEEETGQ